MALKFAANLSTMFQEIPTLSGRYRAAKEAGFRYVECAFPYAEIPGKLSEARRRAGVEHVLMNGWPGDLSHGDLGIACFANRKDEFREMLNLSIEYAKALDCKRMHILAGKRPSFDDLAMEDIYLDNIQYAAKRLQEEGILALIEAINSRISEPKYFLSEPSKAAEYVKKLNHPNLKLQFDLFHVQVMNGNLTANLKENLPYIGHIQISQVPDRGEPDLQGEISYPYIFELLKQLGYNGYIGLEYKPRGNTVEGLQWVKNFGLKL